MKQQEKETLLPRQQQQQQPSSNLLRRTSSIVSTTDPSTTSAQIRQIRLKKQLEFLSKYDYLLKKNQDGTVITFRNLWGGDSGGTEGELVFSDSIVGTQLKVFLPSEYPFKQPTFSHNKQQPLYISQLIDQWSPRFKILQMIQLVKKRIQQRNQLQNHLKQNIIYSSFKAVNSPALWILAAIMLRILVGLGSYSGKGDWPQLGDFEAHRNWMSVAWNRRVADWYREGGDPWWRIDYPPVAAYLSYIFAYLYHRVQPNALIQQRGYQSSSLFAFMRATVLLTDCLFLIPTICLVCNQISPMRYRNRYLFYAFIFIYLIKPDLILIDHGHFQYNSLMLGLILYAFYYFLKGRYYLCCLLYTIAINCKLMAVYFSLAFFGALIGRTVKRYGGFKGNKDKIIRECAIYGVIVIGTTLVIWSPWIVNSQVGTVLSAIFPIHRGLYQLKVPNFWCITDTVLQYQKHLSKPILTFICFVSCAVLSLPSMVALVLKPTQKVLLFAFSCISMTFFMFSYHVHQKSILLPLCFAPLLSQYIGGSIVMDLVMGGCVGMYHLLKEDGQQLGYFVLMGLYMVFGLSYYACQQVFIKIYHPHGHQAHVHSSIHQQINQFKNIQSLHLKYFSFGTPLHTAYLYLVPLLLHLAAFLVAPPMRLPYLWNLLFAFYGFCINAYFLLLSNVVILEEIWDMIRPAKKE